MFDEPLPSKEDLDLLLKLDQQGTNLVEDLYNLIFIIYLLKIKLLIIIIYLS